MSLVQVIELLERFGQVGGSLLRPGGIGLRQFVVGNGFLEHRVQVRGVKSVALLDARVAPGQRDREVLPGGL